MWTPRKEKMRPKRSATECDTWDYTTYRLDAFLFLLPVSVTSQFVKTYHLDSAVELDPVLSLELLH
jgi:hypothetical protein